MPLAQCKFIFNEKLKFAASIKSEVTSSPSVSTHEIVLYVASTDPTDRITTDSFSNSAIFNIAENVLSTSCNFLFNSSPC